MLRRWLFGWMVVLAATCASMSPMAPAVASTVVHMPLETLTDDAERIVQGEVVATHSYWSDGPGKGMILTDVTLKVERTVKGAEEAEVVIQVMGGRVEELAQRVPGEPIFRVGQRALLFLISHRGGLVVMGMNQGCYRIAASEETGELMAAPSLEGLSIARPQVTDHAVNHLGGADAKAAPSPIALEALIERLQTRLRAPSP